MFLYNKHISCDTKSQKLLLDTELVAAGADVHYIICIYVNMC